MPIRLVGGQDAAVGHDGPVIEICVKIAGNLLTSIGGVVPLGGVTLATTSPLRLHGAPTESPLAIKEAIALWVDHLRARGKKDGTLRTYRCLLEASAPALKWGTIEDITAASLSDWMASKREAGEWRCVTLNHNLSAFQNFSRFLLRTKRLAVDPLAELERAEDDGEEGSRPATTAEARAIIRYAWARQKLDGRTRGNRALVWLCCFKMGLRAGEPEKLLWKHVLLDEPTPMVSWTKAIQKNRRPQDCAIDPELVPLLREHRESVPHGPEDHVFPIIPPRHTFNSDRDHAKVEAMNARGQRLSSHAMRKWMATTLTAEKVHPSVINAIMRHSGGVPARYAAISLGDQVSALSKLPSLWPENHENWFRKSLDTDTARPDTEGVTFATLPNSASPPRPAAHQRTSHFAARQAGDSELSPAPIPSRTLLSESGQSRTHPVGSESGASRHALIKQALDVAQEALRLLAVILLSLVLARLFIAQVHAASPVCEGGRER